MPKYELTITPDYVPDWSVVEAVRELFQNALDQQAVAEDNPMFFEYEEEDDLDGPNRPIIPGKLRIGNKASVLQVSSLLLGKTSKAGDDRTIGKFGEGYKIATLVLLRLGKQITFYNYGRREVWRPRLVDSRRYGTRILTFFVDRAYVWERVPDHDLTIVVEGISMEEYERIAAATLQLQDVKRILDTPSGRILLDEKQRGRVYVNGLFVCKYEPYRYGYDFKPGALKLDRDRRLASDFDLKWLSSSMWGHIGGEQVVILAADNAADVAFVEHHIAYNKKASLYDAALAMFQEQYGRDAVPVSCQADLEKVPPGRTGVIVTDGYRGFITSSTRYRAPEAPRVDWLEELRTWFEENRDALSGDACARFERILDGLEDMQRNA